MTAHHLTQHDLFEQEAPGAWHGSANSRYALNHAHFQTIDTPAKARWLGFLAADGCIHEARGGGRTLIVTLKAEDEEYLLALKGAIRYSGPLYRHRGRQRLNEGRPYVTLRVSSPQLCIDLMRHGVTPRKTHDLRPWGGPEHLRRFWYAGYVDGDGWVCHTSQGTWLVGVCGGPAVLAGYVGFLAEQGVTARVSGRPYRNSPGCFSCVVGGTRKPQNVARLLYHDLQDSTPLARKFAAAQRLLAALPERRDWGALGAEEIDRLHASLATWNAVAARLGVSTPQLCALRRRRGMETDGRRGKRPRH